MSDRWKGDEKPVSSAISARVDVVALKSSSARCRRIHDTASIGASPRCSRKPVNRLLLLMPAHSGKSSTAIRVRKFVESPESALRNPVVGRGLRLTTAGKSSANTIDRRAAAYADDR